MKPRKVRSVIVVLDHASGALRLVPEAEVAQRLAGIDFWPAASRALEELTESKVEVTALVPEPLSAKALEDIKLFLPSIKEVAALGQDLGQMLAESAKALAAEPSETLFVAADRTWRGTAVKQGYDAVPHLSMASLLVQGCTLQFVRVAGERQRFDRLPDTVPYFWERGEDGAWRLLAVMSRHAMAEATLRRLRVEALPLDTASEDPLLVYLDNTDSQAADALSKYRILFSDGFRVLVALGPLETEVLVPVGQQHGRFRLLMPNPDLLKPAPDSFAPYEKARYAMSRLPLEQFEYARMPDFDKIVELTPIRISPFSTFAIQSNVNRYSGASALDSSGVVVSRHVRHSDNPRIVQALLNDLNAMGYCAYTHSFSYGGTTLHNVIADLPGTGYFVLEPNILEEIRRIFLTYPFPYPLDPWLERITELVGEEWLERIEIDAYPACEIRRRLEAIFYCKPWLPWWLRHYRLAGIGAQLVIVGCHLDSTAGLDPSYNPTSDPAPGADDDASGIAATLAAASYLKDFAGQLTHTVRFCFFNAEEVGIVGSAAYAMMLKATGAPVRAVVCSDMIGYNSDAARIFEVHAGDDDPAIRDLSVPIANAIASWAATLGTLEPAQVYQGTSLFGGPDRTVYDGAIGRSDHASFHDQGYAAVVVSEDFFANLPTEPTQDANPHYHRATDTSIDSVYAANIAKAIAYAVMDLAQ